MCNKFFCQLLFLSIITVILFSQIPAFAQTQSQQESDILFNDSSLSVSTPTPNYLPGGIVEISGVVYDVEGNLANTKILLTIEKENSPNEKQIVYQSSTFSNNGIFFDVNFKPTESGTYKLTASIFENLELQSWTFFKVSEIFETTIGWWILLATLFFLLYFWFNILGMNTPRSVGVLTKSPEVRKNTSQSKEDHDIPFTSLIELPVMRGRVVTVTSLKLGLVPREILRFILMTIIITSIFVGVLLNDVEIGVNSPIGLINNKNLMVSDNLEEEKLDQSSQEFSSNPVGWFINIGGSYYDNYSSGLQIPFFVVVFGVAGGYIRFLYTLTRSWLKNNLEAELKEELNGESKSAEEAKNNLKRYLDKLIESAQRGDFSESRLKRVYFNKSMQDIALLFLSPILAMATYFLLFTAGLNTEVDFNTLAVVSFSIGLVTDKVISRLQDFAGGLLGGNKDSKT